MKKATKLGASEATSFDETYYMKKLKEKQHLRQQIVFSNN